LRRTKLPGDNGSHAARATHASLHSAPFLTLSSLRSVRSAASGRAARARSVSGNQAGKSHQKNADWPIATFDPRFTTAAWAEQALHRVRRPCHLRAWLAPLRPTSQFAPQRSAGLSNFCDDTNQASTDENER